MNLDEYQRLRDEEESLSAEIERTRGILEDRMSQMKQLFGCSSLPEARSLVRKMKSQEAKLEGDYDEFRREFVERWGELLEVDQGGD